MLFRSQFECSPLVAQKLRILLVLLGVGLMAIPLRSSPVITEFLASNRGGLKDEDGDTSDWIELHNPDRAPVNLEGWALTDTKTDRGLWRLPAVTVPPNGYLVVFASGKNRSVPGLPLHTNFKLDASGEYLALVSPDGETVTSEYGEPFRPQFGGVSFGITGSSTVAILPPEAPVRVYVPTDGSLGDTWREPGFPDAGWTSGTGGIGYETSPADYAGLLGTDVGAAMLGRNGSCFGRYTFVVDHPDLFSALEANVQYDDGFVIWLNGVEVARRSAPESLSWNSLATADHPDSLAVEPQILDPAPFLSALRPGLNVLAVQILNVRLDSSDLLFRISIRGATESSATTLSYFTVPTPGERNAGGVATPGPLVDRVTRIPDQPVPGSPITFTARVEQTQLPVNSVTLVTRVMFGVESTQPMFDDGRHGDGQAGDGIFGAILPAGTVGAGQMLRYRIVATDSAGLETRIPPFFDPRDSDQYLGCVLPEAGIQSRLPVFELFVENVAASESFGGTRACLSHLGEFYDNIGIRIHGQSSSGFPKKSFNLDFNRDHRFRYAPLAPRVKDLKLLTNYGDKSRLHNTLAYEVIHAAGSAGHFAFPVRVQRNGTFHGIMDVVEDADERFLKRTGLNPEGALYKAYDALENPFGSEKKTRTDEGVEDLAALIEALAPAKPIAQRVAYAWDNIDLAQTVSYFVGLALVSSQDHGHKNYFVYRDSTGSGDWSPLPWDVDLTFGRNWTDSAGYFTDTIYTNNVLNFYNSAQQGKPANRFYNLIFQHPEFRAMYLRRLRTVMEEVLQPPGTPAGEGILEKRIGELLDLLDPPDVAVSDADRDEARWGSWGARRSTRVEAQRIINLYLAGRRNWLFNHPNATVNRERIPDSQPDRIEVRIDALDFFPASGLQSEEYVRVTNAEPFAVDLSGWSLRGEIRHTFRPGTVIPAGKSLHVARDVAAFRNRPSSPRRGEGVFVQGNYEGQLSSRGGVVELVDARGRVASVLSYPGNPTSLQQGLRISEVMFHPAPPPPGSPFGSEDFEFLEFKNAGLADLDLAGARLTEGVRFVFTQAATPALPAGARMLLVKNRAAFESRYGPGFRIDGEYLGNLANEGETLRMEDRHGEVLFEFQYRPEWFPLADGLGGSLEPAGPESDLEAATGWRVSARMGGTPGSTRWSAVRESIRIGDSRVALRALGEKGTRYRLESTTTLSGPSWSAGETTPLLSEDGFFELSSPLEGQTQFLRANPHREVTDP
ncbi:MAG: CotH kinase family protein [Verrucomicrobiales bacterium]|nr:CotH kinase family protein [Verrucomicrobiales bacterium]